MAGCCREPDNYIFNFLDNLYSEMARRNMPIQPISIKMDYPKS
jgi:hypothetical protein